MSLGDLDKRKPRAKKKAPIHTQYNENTLNSPEYVHDVCIAHDDDDDDDDEATTQEEEEEDDDDFADDDEA